MARAHASARNGRAGMLLIVIAALMWGSIGIVVDLLYQVAATNAFSIGFLRLALSVPPLLLLSRLFAGPGFLRVAQRDFWTMLLIGASFAAYQVCYFAAIPRIGVAVAVLINICSAPLFIALLASLFLGERLNAVVVAALVGATCGTAMLVGGSPEAESPARLLVGALLALSAGFAYAVIAVAARSIAGRYHPVQPITIAFAIGAALLLPIVLSQGLILSYPPAGWLLLVYLGVVPTALGYALYLWGLRTTPATVSSVLVLLEPLVSTLLAVLLLGERLSTQSIAGAALLLASMLLLYLRSQAQPSGTPAEVA